MPEFLAGCHYNEEEINRHLKKSIRYWPVQINDNKFATGQILKKPVEVVKGQILAGWARKTLFQRPRGVGGNARVDPCRFVHCATTDFLA